MAAAAAAAGCLQHLECCFEGVFFPLPCGVCVELFVRDGMRDGCESRSLPPRRSKREKSEVRAGSEQSRDGGAGAGETEQ